MIQPRRFSWHCQILALFLRSFALFIAPDGITDFGIALAKHCNLVFYSFVLRIDWLKYFLTDHAIPCGVNGLNSFRCWWCNTTVVAVGRKVRFHHTLRFTTKHSCSSVATTSRLHPEVRDHWYQCCHFWYCNMHHMWCSQINFWCLMLWRQIWCCLGYCFCFPHSLLILWPKIS